MMMTNKLSDRLGETQPQVWPNVCQEGFRPLVIIFTNIMFVIWKTWCMLWRVPLSTGDLIIVHWSLLLAGMSVREWRKESSQKLARTSLLLSRFLSPTSSTSSSPSSSSFPTSSSSSLIFNQIQIITLLSDQMMQENKSYLILQDYYEIVEEGTDGVEDEYWANHFVKCICLKLKKYICFKLQNIQGGFYRTQVNLGSDLWVRMSVRQ